MSDLQSIPLPPVYNVVSLKTVITLSCIALYHTANNFSATCNNIETGKGDLSFELCIIVFKKVFRYKCLNEGYGTGILMLKIVRKSTILINRFLDDKV